jgi:RNA polymerase sigma-70 factor (ECF subfamily)
MAAFSAFENRGRDPEQEFFHRLIDDEVVRAIDDLPEEFREVLVLSDLGDLKYTEIAGVLDIPVGTAKSRLFRARRLLQERLREFAVRSGYIEESRS